MRHMTSILAAFSLATGAFGAGSAMAMGDGYSNQRSTTYYYAPHNTYQSSPGAGQRDPQYAPLGSYYGTYRYPEASSYSNWRNLRTYEHTQDKSRHAAYRMDRPYRTTSNYAPQGSYYGTYRYPEASNYSDWRNRSAYQYRPQGNSYTYQYAPYNAYGNYDLSFQRRGIGYDGYIDR